jgi:hypothetical protein
MTKRILRLLLALAALAGAAAPAVAADQNPKAIPVKAVAMAPAASPFFLGFHGGMGFATQEYNFITAPGDVSGTNKLFPTGGLAGITAGVGGTFGSFYGEFYVDADYVFSRGSAQGTTAAGVPAEFTTKNSLELQEGIFLGASMSSIAGIFPAQTVIPAPANWPIPVTVPANFNNAQFIVGPEFGISERQVSACATPLDGTTGVCAQRWIYGPYAGARAMYKVSANWALTIKYDHMFYNSAWTNPGGTNVLGVGAKVINTDAFKAGLTYNFSL